MQSASRNIWVFKTSVRTSRSVRRVKPILNQLLNTADRWNFDLQDCDNILRVEAQSVQPSVINENLRKAGFACAELED